MRAILVLMALACLVLAQSTQGPNRLPLDNVDKQTAATIRIMRRKRAETFAGLVEEESFVYAHPQNISSWLQTLGPTGRWPDSEIDYTSKCTAQRANWPAAVHWYRIYVMTAAWHNSLPATSIKGNRTWSGDKPLRAAIDKAMGWWFAHDFGPEACLDSGGTEGCPCDTPGLWNGNWFANIIYVPRLVGRVCIFLADKHAMNMNQTTACLSPMRRAFNTFHMAEVNGLGSISGANAVDIAAIGIDAAILSANITMLDEAYGYVHRELVLRDKVGEDGIRRDGGFAQHNGLLYSGNYGKDFANSVIAVEIAAVGTNWTATNDQKEAFATLFKGDQWMVYRNTETRILHWDYSVLNRFISLPIADDQATAGLHLNLTQVGVLGSSWNSTPITQFSQTLRANTTSVNAGNVLGTRVFWSNDYVVNRGPSHITSLKMYSSRTQNSECINDQNPFGLHLSDGAMYTYAYGTEYEDIFAAWNWVLIPGTTTFPGRSTYDCATTTYQGKQSFVGGTTDGQSGIAAMKYQHPQDDRLEWQKAWFFLADNIQVVLVSKITPGAAAVTVLDQKKRMGDVAIDGAVTEPGAHWSDKASTLWHGHVGYSFKFQDPKPQLIIDTGISKGDWATIGTSKEATISVNLFTAFVEHDTTEFVYAIFPGTNLTTFNTAAEELTFQVVQNNPSASAIYYPKRNQIFAVFWESGTLEPFLLSSAYFQRQLSISSNYPIVMLYDIDNDRITVADPTQGLSDVKITLAMTGASHVFEIRLPEGGLAGSNVTRPADRVITRDPPPSPSPSSNSAQAPSDFGLRLATILSMLLSFLLFF